MDIKKDLFWVIDQIFFQSYTQKAWRNNLFSTTFGLIAAPILEAKAARITKLPGAKYNEFEVDRLEKYRRKYNQVNQLIKTGSFLRIKKKQRPWLKVYLYRERLD